MTDTDVPLAETLPEKIAAGLAEGVVSGKYQPGERLVEAMLVKEYGVSHGPVRDALRILQNSGLVTIHPYRGAEVTALSVREVQEIYQVRAALVGLRARWIAEDEARAELIARVERPIARLAQLAQSQSGADEYIRVALSINRAFTEGLSNRWLRSMLQALTLQTSRYTRLALTTAARRRESARLWQTLLDAIRSGDGVRAENIASTISLATRDAAIKSLQQMQTESTAPVNQATHRSNSRSPGTARTG
ncbi:MAG: GntR family transcriptional regulator [Vulcanimicrobiaceae bacterium]